MASTEVAKPRGKAAAKTTTTQALTPAPTPGFSYITAGLQERADYIARLAPSTILPTAYRGNAANAFVAAETGAALGLEPLQALASIAVINGRATLSSDLMAAVIRRAGHTLRIVENSPESVTATLIRADDKKFEFTVTWDKDKATKAGLWGQKGPWSQYPTQMLRARAITEVARQGASEALMGMIYSPEDFGATITDTGEVIEAEIVADTPAPAAKPKPASKPAAAPSQPAPPRQAPHPRTGKRRKGPPNPVLHTGRIHGPMQALPRPDRRRQRPQRRTSRNPPHGTPRNLQQQPRAAHHRTGARS